jgi:hypothetical protein
MDWGASTSTTPHEEDREMPENPTGKVSTLTKLLINCVEIIKDEVVMSKLYDIIDHYIRGRKNPAAQRMVNQALHRN